MTIKKLLEKKARLNKLFDNVLSGKEKGLNPVLISAAITNVDIELDRKYRGK